LWGGEEPINLNDVALEIPGDQDDTMKPTKKRKWDKEKKRFVSVFVDPEGREIKDKDKSFTKKKTVEKLKEKYNNWIKKTHVRIQNAGEMEDENVVENAKNAFRSRKELKKMGGQRWGNKNERKGNGQRDLKRPEQVLKQKKLAMKQKRKQGKFNPEKKYEKANRKIMMNSAPSRSKMILKRGKYH